MSATAKDRERGESWFRKWGLTPPTERTAEEIEFQQNINRLIGLVVERHRAVYKKYSELDIFLAVFEKNPETMKRFGEFLKDVSTCPKAVIFWCQNQLNN